MEMTYLSETLGVLKTTTQKTTACHPAEAFQASRLAEWYEQMYRNDEKTASKGRGRGMLPQDTELRPKFNPPIAFNSAPKARTYARGIFIISNMVAARFPLVLGTSSQKHLAVKASSKRRVLHALSYIRKHPPVGKAAGGWLCRDSTVSIRHEPTSSCVFDSKTQDRVRHLTHH
jgi:hypothetical protein